MLYEFYLPPKKNGMAIGCLMSWKLLLSLNLQYRIQLPALYTLAHNKPL